MTALWQLEAKQLLSQGESIVSSLALDLDSRLRFAKGVVVVTDRRLLAREPGTGNWSVWPHAPGLSLTRHDHGGVGHLELLNHEGRLAAWRFALEHHLSALHLVEKFFAVNTHRLQSGAAARVEPHGCPQCATTFAPDQIVCKLCTKAVQRASSKWPLLRLWRFTKPYRALLALGFALMLGSTAAHMIPPYLSMPLMDNVLIPFQNGQPVDPLQAAAYMGGLLGAATLAWVLSWGRTYVLTLVSERIGADLRTATYEHLLGLSLEYFGAKRTGSLMSRIGRESDRVCMFLSLHLLDFASDVLMFVITGCILYSIDPQLTAAALLPMPLIGWMVHSVRERISIWFDKIDRVWSQVNNVLADTIPGIRVVKAFAQEAREAQRFRHANRQNLLANDRFNRTWSLFSPSVSLLTELGLLVIWMFGIYKVSRGSITIGVLTAFIAYSSRFYGRLDSMSRIVSSTEQASSAAKRIFDILDQTSSVPEPSMPVRLTQVRGEIDLRNVSFRHGNRTVNRGISLRIKAGEMIGLVGHSGSGKSTLVNLICRFYDVAEGAIMLDGVDIRSLPVTEYRRNFGLVTQEPFLFFGSIAQNIAYGKPDATRAEIIAAARAAHAHDFILRLPQGYDSLVGERGQQLSGGERQRISIARALLIDPRILILDEATASVDSETEKEIQKALDNLVRGRTTIAIAHRLSTLQSADRLVVLHQGRVIEEGAHDELLARGGAYFRLHQAQARNESYVQDLASADSDRAMASFN